MKFNVDKCVVMNIGNLNIKSKHEYKMNNQIFDTVKHHPYLGVKLTDNMKYNYNINTITYKASRVLRFVKRILKTLPKNSERKSIPNISTSVIGI